MVVVMFSCEKKKKKTANARFTLHFICIILFTLINILDVMCSVELTHRSPSKWSNNFNVSHLYSDATQKELCTHKKKNNMLDNVYKCFGRFTAEPNFIPIQYKSDTASAFKTISPPENAIPIICAIELIT